jgi:hypothetical protein
MHRSTRLIFALLALGTGSTLAAAVPRTPLTPPEAQRLAASARACTGGYYQLLIGARHQFNRCQALIGARHQFPSIWNRWSRINLQDWAASLASSEIGARHQFLSV